MTEPTETRLKRLKIRSWRRGMKEMDLILGRFADRRLVDLPADLLPAYEVLLDENDQDLYLWVTRRISGTPGDLGPDALAPLLDMVADFARDELAQ